MRQPDWRMWLLHDRPREVAQVIFLLHPEWQEFANQTETGNLSLDIPCGNDRIHLECDDNGVLLMRPQFKERLDERSAMTQIEAWLSEEKDARMRG